MAPRPAGKRIRIPLMQQGMVFVPFCYLEAAVNILTNSAIDPFGKIPEFKYAASRLHRGEMSTVLDGCSESVCRKRIRP